MVPAAAATTARSPGRCGRDGAGRADSTLRGGAGLCVELGRGRWRPVLDGGVAVGVGGDPTSDARLTLIGAPLRAGIAVGDDTVLRLTALALPYAVTGGVGDSDVLFGAGLDGRGRVRVGTVDVVFVFGVDAMINQVTYRWGAEVIAATPRLLLWSGVGVAWGQR